MDFGYHVINANAPTKQALDQLNHIPESLTLFVLDDEQHLIGSLTDGDIRRGLLAGLGIESPVSAFMNASCRSLKQNQFTLDDVRALKQMQLHTIPLVDQENRILRIYNLMQKRSVLPLDAMLMAGGEGTRLRPLTYTTPKPLLHIGEKPIIEYNIDRLNAYGVHHLTISIKYLGHQIREYFKDGQNKKMSIRYVEEDQPLGTIGAVRLVPEFSNEYILVMNSDLLTDIDFEDMFFELIAQQGDMIVATTSYDVNIPYGVLETTGELVHALREKPTYTYYCNAGIYIFKKDVIDLIPEETFFNATDLMERIVEQGGRLLHYPIRGYWLDIGKMNDFEKAQHDIKHLKL